MIDSVGRTRQAVEVLAQGLARHKNLADAKASPANLGGNEVPISFVRLGLADVSDWRLVDITARSGGGILVDKDFRARCIWCWDRKCYFVADSDRLRKKTRQEKLGLIGEHANSGILLQLEIRHTLPAHWNGRAERHKSHVVGGQYRTALRKCKMPLRTLVNPSDRLAGC